MANAALQPILPVIGMAGGSSERTMRGLEGITTGAAAFRRGSPLVNSGGYLLESSSASLAATIGIARSDSHGLTAAGTALNPATIPGGIIDPYSPYMEFTPIDAGMIFEINVDDANSQGGATAVLAQTDMWGDFGITKDAVIAGVGGAWYLDIQKAGANQCCNLVGFKDPAGTVNGRVYIVFKQANNGLVI